MGFLKTTEEKAAQAAQKADAAYWSSPEGQARLAYERGDQVFQFTTPLMQQRAMIAVMVGAATTDKATDSTADLNAICRQGWDLLSGSVTFVATGQESRDKFMASGQQVSVSGQVMGYYLFKRAEHNKVMTGP